MNVGDTYKRRFENVRVRLLRKDRADWICVILENELVPDITGTQCTLASWILQGKDWELVK